MPPVFVEVAVGPATVDPNNDEVPALGFVVVEGCPNNELVGFCAAVVVEAAPKENIIFFECPNVLYYHCKAVS